MKSATKFGLTLFLLGIAIISWAVIMHTDNTETPTWIVGMACAMTGFGGSLFTATDDKRN